MINKIKKVSIISLFASLSAYHKSFSAGEDTTNIGEGITIAFRSAVSIKSVPDLILTFVDWIVQLGTVAVVLAFIYVGFQFVAAKGNPEGIKKARDAFFWTVVGTLVLIGSSVLVEVIKSTLIQADVITN